ncbi:recombinase family protein [Streptomyces sp. NPDC056534]|uniref:recombinase family protein n=1 Tax=Streptomyces sp. NPDC056534 TaxID=3345857 RepID=UPI0036824AB9
MSTDQQSTARQDIVLAEAGIEDPVVFEADPGTSSRLHPLQRPKFGELLTYARPGDTVHISEMFRLARGNQHILDVLEVCTATSSPCASTTARSPPWTSPPATRAPASCCPP